MVTRDVLKVSLKLHSSDDFLYFGRVRLTLFRNKKIRGVMMFGAFRSSKDKKNMFQIADNLSREKRESLMHKFKNRASKQSLGLEGSTVNGRTRWGGSSIPTSPQTLNAPVLTRLIISLLMNSLKFLQET